MRAIRTFPGDAASPRLARRWLAGHLPASAPESHRDAALLLVSELVTNSVAHAGTPCTLSTEIDSHRLRVEVADGTGEEPFVASRGVTSDSGRGLVLVTGLASEWGWRSTGTGKLVWFELPLGSAPGPSDPGAHAAPSPPSGTSDGAGGPPSSSTQRTS